MTERTASDAYREHEMNIALAIRDLRTKFHELNRIHKADQKNWGIVGSAQHIHEVLCEILVFLNHPDYGERDGKAVRVKRRTTGEGGVVRSWP